MAHQPLPYAKRQKITSDRPLLDPPAPRQPQFYEVQRAEPATSSSHASTRSSSHKQRVRSNVHGNFVGYYTRRRGGEHADCASAGDPRLALMPREWFEGKKVLDIGCNAGVVTVEMAQRMGAARVVGVDIDDELVRMARHHADLVWSRQAPLADLADSHGRSSAPSLAPPPPPTQHDMTYFPLSMPRMFGSLPAPKDALTTYVELPEIETVGVTRRGKRKVMPVEVRRFPENLRFKHADWVNEEIEYDKRGYNVITALSVTKWIHLHNLNAGLLHFFTRVFRCLLPGGIFILEPQPFSTYAKSAKLSPELKANYERLRDGAEGVDEDKGWRAENGDFDKVLLEQIGFARKERLGETGEKGFRRPVDVYFKREGSWL